MAGATRSNVSTPKITLTELNEKLRDLDTPDSEIAKYLTFDAERTAPLRPALVPNPSRVAMTDAESRRVQGAMAMNWANGAARWRRAQRFQRRLKDAPNDPILVSEGDSWFQFPFYLDDVIDQLGDRYNILSTCAAGDTVKNMLGPSPEHLRSLERMQSAGKKVRALLFSGGGNDFIDVIAGKGGEPAIVNEYAANVQAADYFKNDAYKAKVAFVDQSMRAFLKAMRQNFPTVPVLLHGYDHAIPGKRTGDWRKPEWAKVDGWIGAPMGKRKITDHAIQTSIVKELIDRHNDRLIDIAATNDNAHYVDMRGLITPRDLWADELHPTNDGFRLVADKFRKQLLELGV